MKAKRIQNWRDISLHTSKIRPNMVYRSSHLCPHIHEKYYKDLVSALPIRTIINLRRKDEFEEAPYTPESLQGIEYINISLHEVVVELNNPKYVEEGDDEYFYECYPRVHTQGIKRFFEELTIIETPVVIHCLSGKDRTGMMVALLELLLGTSKEEIIEDYLATKMTTTLARIQTFFKVINEYTNVEDFLISTGLSEETLRKVIEKYKIRK